jgi:hypothetical protein
MKVGDEGRREACLGETTGDRSRCFKVTDSDARARCLANTPH